nr:MAG TPA: hypothetical protein [Caudoviricetes sp.]
MLWLSLAVFLYRFSKDFRYAANLVILYLKHIHPVAAAICSQGVVAYLLILKRPILSVEMRYILIMLLPIHFDYQIKAGQIKICQQILTLAVSCIVSFYFNVCYYFSLCAPLLFGLRCKSIKII